MGAQNNNKTLLMQAVENGKVSEIEKLIKDTTTNIDAVDDEGHTALAYAILHAQAESFECLYEHNADTELFDSHGTSIFMMIQNEKEKALHSGDKPRFEALEQINSTYTRRYNDGVSHSHSMEPTFNTGNSLKNKS